ncbi:NUDIX domain-containing protein [Propionibacteriaceae bacterium Y1685]|uniref:NUDIX domain-containing protein n=1 Tax=Microlunatus sp. Y1700 TaxID=3418487 RepID=UPI003B7D52DC
MDPASIPVLNPAELADQPARWPVTSHEELASGHVVRMVREDITTPDGSTMTREWVSHPGAVAVIAVDSDDHVVLVQQYRHPVGLVLVEPPAGLLDVDGEDHAAAAARELAEEAGVAATDWRVLVDLVTSPGTMSEAVRIFLARDLSDTPAPEGFVLAGEERHMQVVRSPLSDLVQAILAGRVQNPLLTAGVLAAAAARDGQGWDALRPADAPWPARDLPAEGRDRP